MLLAVHPTLPPHTCAAAALLWRSSAIALPGHTVGCCAEGHSPRPAPAAAARVSHQVNGSSSSSSGGPAAPGTPAAASSSAAAAAAAAPKYRHEFFQTPSVVEVNIMAKRLTPERVTVHLSQRRLHVVIRCAAGAACTQREPAPCCMRWLPHAAEPAVVRHQYSGRLPGLILHLQRGALKSTAHHEAAHAAQLSVMHIAAVLHVTLLTFYGAAHTWPEQHLG